MTAATPPRNENSPWRARIGVGCFFGIFLLLGIRLTPDYGLYIDEFTNHVFGLTWLDYVHAIVFDGVPIGPLENVSTHDIVHGPVFEMALAWLGRDVWGITDLREFVLFRHHATWLSFYGATIVVYLMARRMGAHRVLAVFASLLLILQPRIFSHAFYDSVDISFLAFYVVATYTLIRYWDNRTWTMLTLHALACALAISVRSIGGVIPAITMAILVLEMWDQTAGRFTLRRHHLLRLGWIPFAVGIFTFATWPFLWNHPIDRVLEVLRTTPQVGWGGTVLYRGEIVLATELPWHYLPTWILITSPVVALILFSVGGLELLTAFVRRPLATLKNRAIDLIAAATFAAPLAAVIILQAEVYDGWRHLFFIYPAMMLLAIRGLSHLLAWSRACFSAPIAKRVRIGLLTFIALSLLPVVWNLVRLHPYQNVYFNRLAGPDLPTIKRHYELDFWGLSYIEALNYLVTLKPTGPLRIYHGDNSLLAINRYGLAPADFDRIKPVEFAEADFVLCNYRTVRQGFPELEEIFSVEVANTKLTTLYRTHNTR
ncbi:MAG: glycosyltransferase family 39 protein [Synoicihabitans sp.]